MSKTAILAALEDYDPDDIGSVIYDSGWDVGYKDYACREVVIEVTDAEIAMDDSMVRGHYLIVMSRSGNYYSDYDYGPTEVHKVSIKYITQPKLVWEKIKDE